MLGPGPSVGSLAPDTVLPSFESRANGEPRVRAFIAQPTLDDRPITLDKLL